ncbi:MAG: protein-L-isoaspartate(D-aspartate) O-methyltransferase [Gammaproteobacteria bacterium]
MSNQSYYRKFTILAVLFTLAFGKALAEDPYRNSRLKMVDIIRANVMATAQALGRKELNHPVVGALKKVPRHEFVDAEYRPFAYVNRPLPIGHGQTISQPYIVAVMTDLLDVGKNARVLEIGTGSGYQAAILAELVADVYTIEIIAPLAESAEEKLKRLNYTNVHTRTGDGYYGWEEAAPFDAIMVTAAASHIPPPLIKQLKPGGRMLIPVGDRFNVQQLVLVEKHSDDKVTARQILPVAFVPLTGSRP